MISKKNSLSKQRGVVIVVALFIVALVAAMSYIMMARLERDTWRTTLILRDVEAESYAQGSIAWAQDQLRNNWEKQKKDQLIDRVPIHSGVNEVNGYKIESTIDDMQSRFNLNNLGTAEGQASFARLLKACLPQQNEEARRQLIRAVADWITGLKTQQQDEFLDYYLEQPIPYRSAHRKLVDVNELRLVKGIDQKIFAQLRPYVCALPNIKTKVNIQTAAMPVLMSISSQMTVEGAREIMDYRKASPITSFTQFAQSKVAKKYAITAENAAVASDYFLVETKVTIEKQHIVLYTLLERLANETQPVITTLWQSKGSW